MRVMHESIIVFYRRVHPQEGPPPYQIRHAQLGRPYPEYHHSMQSVPVSGAVETRPTGRLNTGSLTGVVMRGDMVCCAAVGQPGGVQARAAQEIR